MQRINVRLGPLTTASEIGNPTEIVTSNLKRLDNFNSPSLRQRKEATKTWPTSSEQWLILFSKRSYFFCFSSLFILAPSRYLNLSVTLLTLVLLPGTCLKTGTLAPNYKRESTFLDFDCYLSLFIKFVYSLNWLVCYSNPTGLI